MTSSAPSITGTGRGPTLALEAVALLLLLANMRFAYVLQYARAGSGSEAAGAASAPLVIMALVLGVSYAFRGARSRRSRGFIACGTLAILFVAQSSQYGSALAERDLTDTERSGLAIEGREVRHRDFRFTLPYPGPGFRFNARIGAAAARQGASLTNVMTWALSDSLETRVVVVQAVKGLGGDRETFERFISGIRKSFAPGTVAVEEDSVEWTDVRQEYRLAVRLPNGVQLHQRCVPSLSAVRTNLVACASTLSDNPAPLAFVTEGLRFER